MNEHWRQGVTPDNNAHVLLIQGLGPKPENSLLAPQYFEWMQIEPLPPEGNYFVNLSQYLNDRQVPHEQQIQIVADQELHAKRPWNAAKHPILAAWLQHNEHPLNLLVLPVSAQSISIRSILPQS